jgi:hypothetical protein
MEMNDESIDKIVRERLLELDSIHPAQFPGAENLWSALDERRKLRARHRVWQWGAVAAMLTITISTYLFSLRNPTTPLAGEATYPAGSKTEVIEFIAQFCADKNIKCDDPAVQQLRSDLEVSFTKLREIDQQIKLYGDDASLIRARARIESHQARVVKSIVQIM